MSRHGSWGQTHRPQRWPQAARRRAGNQRCVVQIQAAGYGAHQTGRVRRQQEVWAVSLYLAYMCGQAKGADGNGRKRTDDSTALLSEQLAAVAAGRQLQLLHRLQEKNQMAGTFPAFIPEANPSTDSISTFTTCMASCSAWRMARSSG